MEKVDAIVLVGDKKSDVTSSFSVFESFIGWTLLRSEKVIPNGAYFAVLTTRKKVELKPDLFVQGYRPHSSGPAVSVTRRRYGEFVRSALPNREQTYDDDVVFYQANLYQVLGDRQVELVLKDGDSYSKEEMKNFVKRICDQQCLEILGDLDVCQYSCPQSEGYFLWGRSYKVWVVLVGKSEGLSLKKKALIFDYETGIPALVEYNDGLFSKL